MLFPDFIPRLNQARAVVMAIFSEGFDKSSENLYTTLPGLACEKAWKKTYSQRTEMRVQCSVELSICDRRSGSGPAGLNLHSP